jgi:predicted RNase H-like HicB family nuclease
VAVLSIIQIKLVPEIDRDPHGTYTAVCTELGLAAIGSTEEEARADLKVAIQSYCNALRRRGLLEKALTESKIRWSEVPVEREPDEVLVDITPE